MNYALVLCKKYCFSTLERCFASKQNTKLGYIDTYSSPALYEIQKSWLNRQIGTAKKKCTKSAKFYPCRQYIYTTRGLPFINVNRCVPLCPCAFFSLGTTSTQSLVMFPGESTIRVDQDAAFKRARTIQDTFWQGPHCGDFGAHGFSGQNTVLSHAKLSFRTRELSS